jgi:hypothetical protein
VDVLVFGLGLSQASNLMDAAFFVRRRTDLKPWLNLSTAIIMLALFAALIPPWGAHGAAWAIVLGSAFYDLVTLVVSQRVFRVRYEPARVAAMVSLAIAVVLAGEALGTGFVPAIGKIALWLAWPLALWKLGLVSPAEKQWVLDGIQEGLARMRALSQARRPLAKADPPSNLDPDTHKRAEPALLSETK